MATQRRMTELVVSSVWKNDKGWICNIHSTTYFNKKSPTAPTITFSGYNPFPCYSMVAPYSTVASWMAKNGWKQLPGKRETWSWDVVNNNGEIIGGCVEKKYKSIPVKD